MRKLLALFFAALLLTGCAPQEPSQPTAPETTQPTVQTEIDPEEAALAMYDWVLNQYRDAKSQNWEPQQCIDAGISYMIAFCDGLTYALADLDGNGNLELLIRCGDTVLDAYTLTDGGPSLIFTGWERNSYRLVSKAGDSGYYILNHGSNGAANSVVNVYRWDGTALATVEALEFNALEDEEKPWFRRDGEKLIPISEEEFNSVEEAYQTCVLADHAL